MRFPSLQSLAGDAARTFRRFPIAILLAAKATVIGILWTHLKETPAPYTKRLHTFNYVLPEWYWNAIVSCYLGMLLSVAATKWGEIRQYKRTVVIALQAGVLVLAGLYYWSLFAHDTSRVGTRTTVLALGLHWLIAVIGFGRGEINGFWIFNKRLFLRALTSYLYVVVLYIGVALALLAVDNLFNADVHWEIYQECWWVLGGLFGVWFFLAGFPRTYENPAVISDYPRGLKIFTQYVLLSLVTVYMLILYAYMAKIIVTWHWPVGWVAWMVMAFAVVGILSLLLIYPLRNDSNSTWIKGYSRFFYLALLPLIILLFTAVYKRITPYGITEQRYFLLALTWWLLFIALYFLMSRKKDIRLVPMTLCIFAFLSVWGPWGAFSVSLHSQKHRLETLLEKYGLLVGGKVVTNKPDVQVPLKDRRVISSVMDYLAVDHGYQVLQPLFNANLDSVVKGDLLYSHAQAIMRLMNVAYADLWSEYADSVVGPRLEMPQPFECLPASGDEVIPTGGAANVAAFNLDIRESDSCRLVPDGPDRLKICPDTARDQIRLSLLSGGEVSTVDLMPLIRQVLAIRSYGYQLTTDEAILAFSGGALSGKVILTDVTGTRTDSRVNIQQLKGIILFSRK